MFYEFPHVAISRYPWISQQTWALVGPLPTVPGAPALPLLQRTAVDDGWPSNGHRDQRADLHAVSDARSEVGRDVDWAPVHGK